MSDHLESPKFIYAQTVNIADQMPAAQANILGQSPLAHVGFSEIAESQRKQAGSVELIEHALLGHIVLRGQANNAGFVNGVEKVLGLALPSNLKMHEKGGVSIRWISPDEWLVIVPAERTFEFEQGLVNALEGHCAVVNVSGGQTLLELSGKDVQNVLKKSMPFDVHHSVYPIGKVVTTVFAKTQAVVARVAEDRWQLVVRRSFSDYVWLWLQDCCAQYTLVVKDEKSVN